MSTKMPSKQTLKKIDEKSVVLGDDKVGSSMEPSSSISTPDRKQSLRRSVRTSLARSIKKLTRAFFSEPARGSKTRDIDLTPKRLDLTGVDDDAKGKSLQENRPEKNDETKYVEVEEYSLLVRSFAMGLLVLLVSLIILCIQKGFLEDFSMPVFLRRLGVRQYDDWVRRFERMAIQEANRRDLR